MPESFLFPLYHATRARCPVSLADVRLHPVFPIGQGLGRAVHTPLPLGVFMLHLAASYSSNVSTIADTKDKELSFSTGL